MCSPTLAVTIGLAAVQGMMQMKQANAEAKAMNVTAQNNAKIAEFNARQSEVKATDAVSRGAQEAADIRQRTRQATSRGRAIMAGTGFLADTGTNVDLQSQNIGMGEVNALTVQDNAEREAAGYRNDAIGERFGATVDTANAAYKGKITKYNGLLSGVGTFVSGTANAGIKAGWFDKKGK